MTQKILSYIRNHIPQLPEISKDKVSSAALAAIKQLPWVVGTGIGFHLGIRVVHIVALGSSLAWLATLYYLSELSRLEPKERGEKILLILKIATATFAILLFANTAHTYSRTLLLFKAGIAMSASPALLITLVSMYQSAAFGKHLFGLGLSIKRFSENTDKIKEKITDLCKALDGRKLSEVSAGLEAIDLGHLVYLAKKIFPKIYKDSQYLENLKKKYVSPLTDEEITQITTGNPDLPSLERFVSKFAQLEELIHSIEKESPRFRAILGEDKLRKQHLSVLTVLDRFKKSYSDLFQDHIKQFAEPDLISIGRALDGIGFTVGDYNRNFPSRQNLAAKLRERGIYCLGDLKQKNIVGGIEKEKIIKRIKDYLDGKPLEPLQNTSLPTHSRVERIATAFFNIIMTGVTLGTQFALAPWLTGLGVAYGFYQEENSINLLRHYRFSQANLFFPTPLIQKCCEIRDRLFNTLITQNTTTKIEKIFTFIAGINQGETLRAYFNHIFNKY